MLPHARPALEALHRRIGHLLRLCNGFLAVMVGFGVLFSLLTVLFMNVLCLPEPQSLIQQIQVVRVGSLSVDRAMATPPSATTHDPSWDGLVAGMTWGLTLGQEIPLIGFIVGPIAGATLGYSLDRKF